MLGYQPGVKKYMLWCIELDNHKIADACVDESQVESGSSDVEVEAVEPEGPSQSNPHDLRNYMLAKDRTRRVSKLPAKYAATYRDVMNNKE